MGFIKQLFLEDFVALAIGLGCVVCLWLIIWHVRRPASGPKVAAGLLVFTVLALCLEKIVVTDREAIGQLVHRTAQACRAGDLEALEATLDGQFTYDRLDRQETLRQAEGFFSRIQITSLRLPGLNIDTHQNPPRAKVLAFARLALRNGTNLGWDRSTWQLTFIQRGEDWYLLAAKQLSGGLKR